MTYFQDFRWIAVTACVAVAAVLAWRKVGGWGWFLFIAFVAATVSV